MYFLPRLTPYTEVSVQHLVLHTLIPGNEYVAAAGNGGKEESVAMVRDFLKKEKPAEMTS